MKDAHVGSLTCPYIEDFSLTSPGQEFLQRKGEKLMQLGSSQLRMKLYQRRHLTRVDRCSLNSSKKRESPTLSRLPSKRVGPATRRSTSKLHVTVVTQIPAVTETKHVSQP